MKLSLKKTFPLLLALALAGCGENTVSSNPSNTSTSVPSDTSIPSLSEVISDSIIENEYVYEGTPTVAPYVVYNTNETSDNLEDDTVYSTHQTLYNAIRDAGANATSKNKMYVLDGNGLKVFQRQSKTNCWCYDGTNFVGSMAKTDALAWGQDRIKSYIVDGQGIGYIACGTNYYEGSDLTQEIPLEIFSGGYNYMFSDHGRIESDVWVKQGFGYMECNVRLSEATYKPSADGSSWNAYIFINGSGGFHSDLGLIGVVRNNQVVWAIVRNCSHDDHKTNESQFGSSFLVLDWTPVTTMSYDPTLGVYNGADDLLFQCYQGIDGWTLNITNLTNNKVFTIEEKHDDMFVGKTGYFRFLLAASYCPVVGNVWDARCGASLRNVVFDGVKVARWNEQETYTEDMLEDFYPDSNMIYGFSQAADCASCVYSTHSEDGTYKSGLSYKKDEKYLSFSCYYDGGGH